MIKILRPKFLIFLEIKGKALCKIYTMLLTKHVTTCMYMYDNYKTVRSEFSCV